MKQIEDIRSKGISQQPKNNKHSYWNMLTLDYWRGNLFFKTDLLIKTFKAKLNCLVSIKNIHKNIRAQKISNIDDT